MTYFTPDRSNRPTDDDDPTGGTKEAATGRTRTIALTDGRQAVTEAAFVDGLTLYYYYFDATGFEEATTDELRTFLTNSGINFSTTSGDVKAYFSSTKILDAQDRPIWEFQVTYA